MIVSCKAKNLAPDLVGHGFGYKIEPFFFLGDVG